MSWYLMVLKRYADFSGRSRRREYWMFVLLNFVISVGVALIDNVIGSDVAAGVESACISGILMGIRWSW